MARLSIVNPIAIAQADTSDAPRIAPAARPKTLDGKRIALYWNGKPLGDIALERTKEGLARSFRDVTFIDVFGEKGGINRYLSPEQLDMLERDADVVIGTSGD